MIVFKIAIFSRLKKETMTSAKKQKIKTKNGRYNNNMFCAIVMGI